MGIINKLVKEKTTKGIFDGIKYSVLEVIAFIALLLFMLNPALKVLIELITGVSIYPYMHGFNPMIMKYGIFVVCIYFKKKMDDGAIPNIKEFFKSNLPVILFLAFGVLMVFATLLNGWPKLAIVGSYYRGEGLIGFISYLVYFIFAAFIVTPKNKERFLTIFAVSSTFVGGVIFVDYIILNDKYGYAMKDHMIFSQYNHLGYYLLMSIMTFGMLFIVKKKLAHKVISLIGFSFMTAVLMMNDTWGCQLALLVGVVFTVIVYSIAKGKFQAITLLLLVAMAATYIVSYVSSDRLKENIEKNIMQQVNDTKALVDKDDMEYVSTGVARIILWENALKMLWESPVIGHGADMTGERLKEITHDNDRCHCEFLNYAVSFGIPTAIVYTVAVFTVYLRGLFKKKQLTDSNLCGLCIAFAYLASSLIGNSMFYTAPFLFIALGFGYVNEKEKEISVEH